MIKKYTSKRRKQIIRLLIGFSVSIFFSTLLVLNVFAYLITSTIRTSKKCAPRLLFGVTPIISIAYISRALKQNGYFCHTVVSSESSIYKRDDFDFVLMPSNDYSRIVKFILWRVRTYCFFMYALWSYDIFHYYFDGGILSQTLFAKFELYTLKLCKKKIVLLPYGSDAFVYDMIPNPIWRHGLMLEYAQHGNNARKVQQQIRCMTRYADVVIACLVHFINLPRWDVLPLTCYPVDTAKLQPSYSKSANGQIKIAHASNHRGIKGTAFLIQAVNQLKTDGFDISLDIIEKVPNEAALARIEACDIYVDQLIFGYAQAALEAMALGKIVISALDDSENNLFRIFSYLNECPIQSANVTTIYNVLKKLLENQHEWESLSKETRQYVQKRHSFLASASMFTAIYQKIWYEDLSIDLINFYNPLLEKNNENSTSPS